MKKKLALSFIDQGIVSASNFITSLILARILNQSDFGFFSFLFFVSILVGNMQVSIISQPHNVLAATLKNNFYNKYTNGMFGIFSLFILFLTLVSLLISLVVIYSLNYSHEVFFYIFMIVYLNIKLCHDFLRRILFTSGNVETIVIGDIISYGGSVFMLLVLAFLFKIHQLSLIISFLCFPFLLSIIFLIKSGNFLFSFSRKDILYAFHKSYNFAKWSFFSTMISWFATRIFPVILGIFCTMESVAIYAVLMNIINLLNPIFYALTNFLTSVFAKVTDKEHLLQNTIKAFFLLLPLVSTIMLFLILFPDNILSFLYGSRYQNHATLLQYLSISIIFIALSNVLQLYLRSNKQIKYIFKSFLYTSLLSSILGIILIYHYSVLGAVVTFDISWIFSNVFLIIYVVKTYKVNNNA